jgi:hypothetical protein
MGMLLDMTEHISLACIDDINRRGRIANAREAIYVKHFGVSSALVEKLLKV